MWYKKLIILIIAIFGIMSISNAQTKSINNIDYQKIGTKWYQLYNGNQYEVDESVVTVKFVSGLNESQKVTVAQNNNCTILRSNSLGYYDLQITGTDAAVDVVEDLVSDASIEYAEPNTIGEFIAHANDTYYWDQWHLHHPTAGIDAYKAWDKENGDPDVVIGILDSGTDILHEDLEGNIWVNPGEDLDGDGVVWDSDDMNGIDDDGNGLIDDLSGWDFENNNNELPGPFYHGTHVAGIVGAETNNAQGVAGVAGGWTSSDNGCSLLIAAVGDYSPHGSILDDAILYAEDEGAKVITMSLTVGYSQAIVDAINDAYNNGVFVDNASGNNYSGSLPFPANVEHCFAVGASNQSELKADFSNYGGGLMVVAPGVDIKSTRKNNTYGTGSGTSYASPQVAGTAGLIASRYPDFIAEDIEEVICLTAKKLSSYTFTDGYEYGSWNNQVGYGLLNADRAIGIKEDISSNQTLVEGNYVSDEVHVTNNSTLTLDDGSRFYLLKTGELIVNPDANINLEPNAKILLKNNSTMHLNTASHCIVANNGNIEVKSGTTFYIDDCGILEIIGNGKLIVRSGATLCISPNAVLAFENGLQNLIMESGVIIPNGYVDPTILINNTLSNYTINTNTTWTSENYFVNGSLTIEPQSSLTIQTSTLNFVDKNSNIIVKPGAKLILNGATLTNACSEPWQGIQVWGDKNHSQYPDANGNYAQGYLELKNGAVIENAVCAVDLWKPDDWSSTGGIVYADNVTFRNNAKSVHALFYHNYNPYDPTEEWEYSSNFKNCTFEITADYPGTETFYKHVDMSHVNGIDFQHCDFSVADNVNGVATYNIGIAGYDAQFKVTALCSSQVAPCPEEDLEKCTFTGFYRGISALNDGGSPVTFYVENANFINNAYGVKTRSMDNATVLFSDFEIGEHYCDSGIKSGAGINSDNVTGFAYEENNFSKYTGGPQANYFGIVINDSKDVNEVYKNSFTGLSYANFADGINWLWNGNPDEDNRYKGLAYYCNQNSNNYADFYVSENRPSGIQAFQGSDNNPAGNTFTQNGATWHFYNGGEHLVQYFYNQNAPNEIPDPTKVNDVALTAVNDENGCPSHYGNDIRVVLTAAQKADAEQTYYDNLSDYNNIKTLYDSYKDGGSTSDEELDIETAQPDDMWALRSQLLGDSPHLSFDVLKKAADKTDVFTESALFDILAANPDELRKDTLISYLENKEQPLPDYMIDLLKQLAEGTTYKTALQEQMADYKHAYTGAALDIVRSILNDTVMNDTLLRNWLDNIGGINSDRQIISSYISKGDFTDAYTLANMLPNLYGLHGADSIEHLYYMDLLHLQDTLYQQGRNTYQLDSAEKTLVENIAASSNDVAGSYAKSILEAVYNDYYPDCPEVNNTAGYKHGNVINSETLGKVYGLDITVKPNPAGQWAAFDYTLPKDETNATITITNAVGSIVKVLNVTGHQGQKLFDTRSLSSGIYLYTLKSGQYTKSGKMVIQK